MNSRQGSSQPEQLPHSQFLVGAAAFEGLLLMVAFVLGWVLGCSPTQHLIWSSHDFLLGLLATIPMLLLLAVCFLTKAKGILAIRTFLRDTMGPLLGRCHLLDLFLLALLAGLCEEILFRGLLYFRVRDWNPMLAVLVSNLLFGVAHAITPLYALLAAFIGLYLTALVAADPSPNLLIPVTAHTMYDFIAFLVVVWDYRRHAGVSADDGVPESNDVQDGAEND